MAEKKSRKTAPANAKAVVRKGKAKRRKKRFAGDGSLFLTFILILLCVAAVFFLKDFYTQQTVQTETVADNGTVINEKTAQSSPLPETQTSRQPQKVSDSPKQETAVSQSSQKPVLCFVIDDVGHNLEDLQQFLKVPGKVTFAVLPKLRYSSEAAKLIRAAGQELLLHQPMEAFSGVEPGPGLLTEAMSEQERLQCLNDNLQSVPGAVGVNNHMGSKGTSSLDLSLWLLQALKAKNLFFLDSRTSAESKMRQASKTENWKMLERNSMFLDNEKDTESLKAAVEAGKATARKEGHAVMIGHAVTSELAELMMTYYPALTEEGFIIENLTYLLNEARGKNEGTGD